MAMYMSICVCVHINMCIYMCDVYMYIYMCVCMCCVYVYMYTCTCLLRLYLCMYICVFECIYLGTVFTNEHIFCFHHTIMYI